MWWFLNSEAPVKRKYLWKRDFHDDRDLYFFPAIVFKGSRPEKVDMRKECPPIYDQGSLGSCTTNALCGAYHFDELKQGISEAFLPSRLFLYYNERDMEGTVSSDSGASLRDGCKSLARQGVCSESEWPYDVDQFAVEPPLSCYRDASSHRCKKYHRLSQDINNLEGCLAAGYPFVFGIMVYESFESPMVMKTGIVPLPNPEREELLGGHAIMAVGYDRKEQNFICRNSWGASWGMDGYCTIPYQYVLDRSLASDFWCISAV